MGTLIGGEYSWTVALMRLLTAALELRKSVVNGLYDVSVLLVARGAYLEVWMGQKMLEASVC